MTNQLSSTWINFTTAGVLAAGLTLTAPASATDLEASDGQGHEHHHHIAVILGTTHTEHDVDAFTIGVDYEYRLSSLIGVGVLGEYATGDVDAWVVGVPFACIPVPVGGLSPCPAWRFIMMRAPSCSGPVSVMNLS
jgi:hypothetical protein